MKPADSDVVRVRKTAVIGSLATRAITPLARASSSLIPTRARGGSMNMQYGTVRPVDARLAPFRLSRIKRKSSSDIWVNCGVPAHSPIAQVLGTVVSSRSLTRRLEVHTLAIQSLIRNPNRVFHFNKKNKYQNLICYPL